MDLILIIIISIITSILTVLFSMIFIEYSKKECQHLWIHSTTESEPSPFDNKKIIGKKMILKCNKCGEVKIKNIF